jgi:SAM-dependent methyltransferase/nicotinamide mononucleotide adenylyltransferase
LWHDARVSRVALLVGRFIALTRGQAALIAALGRDADVGELVCVVTSASESGTRRNPLSVETRERMLRPAFEAAKKSYTLVRLDDIADDAAWPAHLAAAVEKARGRRLVPSETRVVTANRDVTHLLAGAGFSVEPALLDGDLTPSELIERAATGQSWQEFAARSTIDVLDAATLAELKRIHDLPPPSDGELAEHRDFDSYSAQMDAALAQKLADIAPWVVPGCIVDKGCGTGRLLVELSRRWPRSAFVGVDLSREFLRRSDENTYGSGDVRLVRGDAAAVCVPESSATTVIYSSIMHEIYSYAGYSHDNVARALRSTAKELRAGGRVIIRDGVCPPEDVAPWRMRLCDEPTRAAFARFAAEFKHGQGARHERISDDAVRLSARLANEFLCKKDYQTNWAIEVHEEYGVRSEAAWCRLLVEHGFVVDSCKSYVNDWIAEHRYAGHVELTDDAGRTIDWPPTNLIVAATRS